MSIAASELSSARLSKGAPAKKKKRQKTGLHGALHRAVSSSARRRRSDRSLRLRGGDGQRDKADYRLWSPTVCSSTGAFQAPHPGEDAHRPTAPLLSRKNILRVRGKFPSGSRCVSEQTPLGVCMCVCVNGGGQLIPRWGREEMRHY